MKAEARLPHCQTCRCLLLPSHHCAPSPGPGAAWWGDGGNHSSLIQLQSSLFCTAWAEKCYNKNMCVPPVLQGATSGPGAAEWEGLWVLFLHPSPPQQGTQACPDPLLVQPHGSQEHQSQRKGCANRVPNETG